MIVFQRLEILQVIFTQDMPLLQILLL